MAGRRTSVTNVYTAPAAPPAQQVITSGSVRSIPATSTVSGARIASPPPDLPVTVTRFNSTPTAWNSVPFVPNLQPAQTVARPTISLNIGANDDIIAAQAARDSVCEDIVTDSSLGNQEFTITGNGSALRFRFPLRGAPSNVVVVNLATGATVSSTAYSVLVRADSFSWLVFDTAPANNVDFRVSYTIGDSGIIRSVNSQKWSGWQSQIRDIENRLARVRDAVNSPYSNARYVGGNTTAGWSIGDPTLIGDAEQAVRNLRTAIRRPGQQINTAEVASICDYLNSQLQRIENQLSRSEFVGGVRPTTGNSATYQNTDSRIASRIYQNDIRFSYFVGPANAAIYNPPNTIVVSQQRWVKRFDNISGRFFYSIV